MSSWEEIADEVVPRGPTGLATGAHRGGSRPLPRDAGGQGWPCTPEGTRVLACPPCVPHAPLDEVLRGALMRNERGTFYRAVWHPSMFELECEALCVRLCAALAEGRYRSLAEVELCDVLFMDIETTGLSGQMPLFLIGTLRTDDEQGLVVEFFLARHRREEAAVLAAFHAAARGKTLVTFNGHSFDWPYIVQRSNFHDLEFDSPREHFDLLPAARAAWKRQLPNCRLQTLEAHLLERGREGDVPSAHIPRAFLQFESSFALDGGGSHLMLPIIYHNAIDLLTTAELLALCPCDAPPRRRSPRY